MSRRRAFSNASKGEGVFSNVMSRIAVWPAPTVTVVAAGATPGMGIGGLSGLIPVVPVNAALMDSTLTVKLAEFPFEGMGTGMV